MRITFTFLFLFTIQVFAGTEVGESTPAPFTVELIAFTANLNGSKVEIRWITATEVKNYGFEVERVSLPTNEDEPGQSEWTKVGFVAGHGTSNSRKEYSFTETPEEGTKFEYRLKQLDTDGKFSFSKAISIEITTPNQYSLNQNYPNPFNPSTVITYSIPASSHVSVSVYNVLGNLIATLVNQNQEAGNYTITFNADELINGVYFYRMQSGSYGAIKKMILIK